MMNGKTIPLVYKIILKKFWENSDFGLVKIRQVKTLLRGFFRLGKQNFNAICCEMKKLGYIEYVNNRSGIKIMVDLKDLV